MRPYTYLLINFLTIIVCFIFSFHPKIRFDRYFGFFIKACVIVAIPFLLWDAWFTHLGIWWFNLDYTLGVSLVGMPLEEWLFFLCIPFSCMFTYYCLQKFFAMEWAERYNTFLALLLIMLCIAVLVLYYDKLYPTVTAIAAIITIVYIYFIAGFRAFGKTVFIYTILMFGFIPVNGTLTGTGLESPVVNYNPDEIIGLRILTIPVEDFVYGYVLFLLNVYIFQLLTRSVPVSETISTDTAILK